MIDYTGFPLGLHILGDKENDEFVIYNSTNEKVDVIISLNPKEDLTLPYSRLLFSNESRIKIINSKDPRG
jgi:hypothetical protein